MSKRDEWLKARALAFENQGQWSELIFLRIAYRFFPALRSASRIVDGLAADNPDWKMTGDFLRGATSDPFQAAQPFWNGFPEEMVKVLSRRESASLQLLCTYGFSFLRDFADGHPAQRSEILNDALLAVKEGLRLARREKERGCECLFLSLRALSHDSVGEPLKAIADLKKALALRQRCDPRIPEVQDPMRAPDLNNLGDIYLGRREYGKAWPFYRASAQIYAAIAPYAQPSEQIHRLYALNNCVLVLYRLGRFKEALKWIGLTEEAWRNTPDHYPRERQDRLASLLSISGMVFDALGRFEEAISACDRAIGYYRQNAEAKEQELARTLSNRANTYHHLGQLTEAMQDYVEASAIYARLSGGVDLGCRDEMIGTLTNQALTQVDLRQWEPALEAIDLALRQMDKIAEVQPMEMERAAALNTRTIILAGIGRTREALEANEEALKLLTRLNRKNSGAFMDSMARAHINRANSLGRLQRWEEALPHCAAILPFRKRCYRQDPLANRSTYSSALDGYGVALAGLGRTREAIRFFRQALGHRRVEAELRPSAARHLLAATLVNLGSELLKTKRWRAAWPYLEEAVQLIDFIEERAEQVHAVSWLTHAATYLRRLAVTRGAESLRQAKLYLDRGRELDRASREDVSDPANRRGFSERHQPLYDLAFAVALDLWEMASDEVERQAHLEQAVAIAEAGRARWSTELLDERERQQISPVLRETIRKLQWRRGEIEQQLSLFRSGFDTLPLPASQSTANEVFRGFVNKSAADQSISDAEQKWRAELTGVERELQDCYHRQSLSAAASISAPRNLSAAQLQRLVPPGAVAIYIVLLTEETGRPVSGRGMAGSVVLAISEEKIHLVRLPGLTVESVIGVAGDWLSGRSSAVASLPDSLAWSSRLPPLLQFLGRTLVQTVGDHLEKNFAGSRKVLLIPHRILHLFPLGACPWMTAGGSWMRFAERFHVSTLPSLGVLSSLSPKSAVDESQNSLIVEPRTPGVVDLPFASFETSYLGGLLPGPKYMLVGREATKAAFLDRSEGASLLHFCGHAEVNLEDPLQTRLLLHGQDALTVADCLSQLVLGRCQLAVLNCCDAAHALPVWGDDQIPLSLAFVVAGAQCVISTLWHADDSACALFIARFYERLTANESPVAALAESQRWLREIPDGRAAVEELQARFFDAVVESVARELAASKTPPFADPFFWAGYIVVGLGWMPVSNHGAAPAEGQTK